MFSKSCTYAIRAVLYLALHTDPENKVGVKTIAEALDVPKPFLAKLLQQLSRHRLISSSRGLHGGFFLSEQDQERSLRTVIESIEGPEVFTSCILGLPTCSSQNPCPFHDKALLHRNGLEDAVTNHTIREFAQKIKAGNLTI